MFNEVIDEPEGESEDTDDTYADPDYVLPTG